MSHDVLPLKKRRAKLSKALRASKENRGKVERAARHVSEQPTSSGAVADGTPDQVNRRANPLAPVALPTAAADLPTGAPGSLANFFLQSFPLERRLTVEELQSWFGDVVLPRSVAATLANEITKLYLALPGQEPESYGRVARALAVLRQDLPVYINDLRELAAHMWPGTPRTRKVEQRLALLSTLQAGATALVAGERMFEARRPGRQHEAWHSVAGYLAPHIISVLKGAGAERPGFGNPTAPAVDILSRALKWLEVCGPNEQPIEPEAIVKAMRQFRQKRKQLS